MSSPSAWPIVKLESVCDFLDGKRVPVNLSDRNRRIEGKQTSELYPYYGANGQVGLIDGFIFSEPLILLAEDGGFFGSEHRPIAYAASGKFWVNNHAHVLRPKREVIDFDYCLHAIRVRPDIGALVAGSTRPKLTREAAGNITLPLPPFDTQQRIAARLSERLAEVERARLAVGAQLQAAEALRAAFLRAAFTNAPAHWPRHKLIEVADISAGVALGRKLSANGIRRVPYLRVANVKDGRLDLSEVKETGATESEIGDCLLQYGDVLLTEGGDPDKLGRGTFWRSELPECILQNHVFRVRFGTNAEPAFMAFQFGSEYGKAYFFRHAKQTTGIATINRTVLGNFPLILPPLAEQQATAARIHAEFDQAQSLREQLAQKLAAVEKLPATLLREAFSGRV